MVPSFLGLSSRGRLFFLQLRGFFCGRKSRTRMDLRRRRGKERERKRDFGTWKEALFKLSWDTRDSGIHVQLTQTSNLFCPSESHGVVYHGPGVGWAEPCPSTPCLLAWSSIARGGRTRQWLGSLIKQWEPLLLPPAPSKGQHGGNDLIGYGVPARTGRRPYS